MIGAYHSHPSGPAEPSATDRAEAVPDFLYLIVGLGAETPDVRLWTLEDRNFVQVGLVGAGGAGALGKTGGR
ncbi:MAG: Mov34/MPN/PAD-1 family protein [Vicinamibacterales bacterium]